MFDIICLCIIISCLCKRGCAGCDTLLSGGYYTVPLDSLGTPCGCTPQGEWICFAFTGNGIKVVGELHNVLFMKKSTKTLIRP